MQRVGCKGFKFVLKIAFISDSYWINFPSEFRVDCSVIYTFEKVDPTVFELSRRIGMLNSMNKIYAYCKMITNKLQIIEEITYCLHIVLH